MREDGEEEERARRDGGITKHYVHEDFGRKRSACRGEAFIEACASECSLPHAQKVQPQRRPSREPDLVFTA